MKRHPTASDPWAVRHYAGLLLDDVTRLTTVERVRLGALQSGGMPEEVGYGLDLRPCLAIPQTDRRQLA